MMSSIATVVVVVGEEGRGRNSVYFTVCSFVYLGQ